MTYRTQQLLALAGLTLVASLASTASLYTLAQRHLYDEYRAKLLSIACTAAALTDGSQFSPLPSLPTFCQSGKLGRAVSTQRSS
jgi:hypothetical protein